MLEKFILICLYSLGLRWMLFRYILFKDIREWLGLHLKPIDKLLHCPYCQTIEASALVYFALWFTDWQLLVQAIFGTIAIGWIAIVIDETAERAIERMEKFHNPSGIGSTEPRTGFFVNTYHDKNA